jgi:hypothetical protein
MTASGMSTAILSVCIAVTSGIRARVAPSVSAFRGTLHVQGNSIALYSIITHAKTLISLVLAHKTQYTLARSAIDPVIGGPAG